MDLLKPTQYTTRDAWLEARKRGLGGTDIAAILGASPWRTEWHVWASKRGVELDESVGEAAMWGRRLEQAVADWWEDANDGFVRRFDEAIWWSESHPFAFASLDGLVVTFERGAERRPPRVLAIYEGKVSSGRDWHKWGQDGDVAAAGTVPEHYRIQCHWYMAVTGLPRAYIACLFRGTEGRSFVVERDDELCAAMLKLAGEWWQRHIIDGEEPQADASKACAQALTRTHEPDPDQTIGVAPELAAAMEDHQSARDDAKRARERVAAAANRIRQLMGSATAAVAEGYRATWRDTAPRQTIDAELLWQLYPDAYEACLNVGTAERRLDVRVKR